MEVMQQYNLLILEPRYAEDVVFILHGPTAETLFVRKNVIEIDFPWETWKLSLVSAVLNVKCTFYKL